MSEINLGIAESLSVEFFAHTHEFKAWEPLEEHLHRVAELAEKHALTFASSEWGRILGLWHDLGKYSNDFQQYLRKDTEASQEGVAGRVDHSTAGARHAFQVFKDKPPMGTILAYCIAGHHAGLADWDVPGSERGLRNRLYEKSIPPLAPGAHVPEVNLTPPQPPIEWIPKEAAFQLSVWCRMLFSALVDADFLATELFMDEARAAQRAGSAPPTLAELEARLTAHLQVIGSGDPTRRVNQIRRQVLDACRGKASLPPGFFSLNVPTGGGKTLSSLAFALAHVRAHPALRRVIYVIPYTSIIEQTANVYREALGPDADQSVLEHHSNLSPEHDSTWTRLASENWDASLIVTTNVQFFESLFANRTSACRKLHNIARSVIILDEAQMLNVGMLKPCLAILRELVRNYGCTIVLCTATQPAIEWREDFAIGIENTRPIIDDPAALHAALKRVEGKVLGPLDDESLARRLASHESALCIVNTRPHARQLFELLRDAQPEFRPRLFHLSALMCPEHRSRRIAEIRRRLHDRQPTVVISTQLIEAGVDLDFPVVYRALAGLDSIAQAAGRCNREGKLARGELFIFNPLEQRMPPMLRTCADQTSQILPDYLHDPLSPDAVRNYFELLYWQASRNLDEEDVMECFKSREAHFDFNTAAERFQWIKEAQVPIVVPYGSKGRRICDRLRESRDKAGRDLLRQAQRYTVQVPEAVALGIGQPINDRLKVLIDPCDYDESLGLLLKRHPPLDCQVYVV